MQNLASLPALVNPTGLTPSQITDICNHTHGLSLIDFSFRLLDMNLNPISVPGGAASDPSELPPDYVQNAKIELNTQRDVPRQMTLDLIEGAGLTYDPLHHRLQVFCDYYAAGTYTQDGAGQWHVTNGTRILHVPLGVFMAVLPDRDHGGQQPIWHLTLYDEIYRLSRLKFGSHYVFPTGSNWISAAITLLELSQNGTTPAGCSISGPAWPSSRISIPGSSSVLPIDVTFTETDTWIGAVNGCLKGSDTPYWPLVQDEWGNLVSSPIPYYTTAWPSIAWTFDTTPGNPAIIRPPVKQTFGDVSAIANEVTVLGQNPNSDAVSATVQNTNSDSAISIPSLGYVMNKIISDSNITTVSDCYTRALLELQGAAAINESIAFDCLPVPFLQANDAIAFTQRGPGTSTYTNVGTEQIGVAYTPGPVLIDGVSTPFQIISSSLDLNTRIQSITAGRIVAL